MIKSLMQTTCKQEILSAMIVNVAKDMKCWIQVLPYNMISFQVQAACKVPAMQTWKLNMNVSEHTIHKQLPANMSTQSQMNVSSYQYQWQSCYIYVATVGQKRNELKLILSTGYAFIIEAKGVEVDWLRVVAKIYVLMEFKFASV